MIVYPAITAMTAGVIVILQMALMLHVAMGRMKYRQGLGDGDKPALRARIRMHGNLAENGSIILVMMALLEMAGANRIVIGVFGVTFITARMLHPIGLMISSGTTVYRFAGAVLTMLVGFFGGVYLVIMAITQI